MRLGGYLLGRTYFFTRMEVYVAGRPQADTTRVNDEIRAREVRLIGADGAQLGIVPIADAMRRAQEAELDLVEVAPDAVPPICKIYDYKKALYEKKKKLKESKKKVVQTQLKEVKARVVIDPHDLAFKIKRARQFLEKGDKVKFTIVFRGREITKPELGQKVIDEITKQLVDIGELEQLPSRMGKQIILIMARRKDWTPAKAPSTPAP